MSDPTTSTTSITARRTGTSRRLAVLALGVASLGFAGGALLAAPAGASPFPVKVAEPADPEPQGPGDLAIPTDDPDPDPTPEGPDDLANPTGCDVTHGCDEDVDDDPEPEVEPEVEGDDELPEASGQTGASGTSGTLPRTGGGIALLGAVGATLAGLGAGLRHLGRRSGAEA